jgi:hypothetical protein
MVYCNRLAGGGYKAAYVAEFGNGLIVNDTLKGRIICQMQSIR